MKKIQFAKKTCKLFLIALIISAVVFSILIPGYSWIKVHRTAKQQGEASEIYDGPTIYALLLDTDPSMEVNFLNLGDSMKDHLKLCLCLLDPEDTFAVFLRNSGGEPVVFHGADDPLDSVQRVDDIDFAIEDKGTSDGWIEEATAFLSDYPETRTQLQIITDKSLSELEAIGLTAQAADDIQIIASANNTVFSYLDGDIFSSAKIFTNGEKIAKDYTFNQHYFVDKAVRDYFHLNLRFPEPTDGFVVVLSGEDMYLVNVYLTDNDVRSTGFPLSNGDRVFLVEAGAKAENGYILGSGNGTVSVIYSAPSETTSKGRSAKQLKVWEDNFTLSMIVTPWVLVFITVAAYLILMYVERKIGKASMDSVQAEELTENEHG